MDACPWAAAIAPQLRCAWAGFWCFDFSSFLTASAAPFEPPCACWSRPCRRFRCPYLRFGLLAIVRAGCVPTSSGTRAACVPVAGPGFAVNYCVWALVPIWPEWRERQGRREVRAFVRLRGFLLTNAALSGSASSRRGCGVSSLARFECGLRERSPRAAGAFALRLAGGTFSGLPSRLPRPPAAVRACAKCAQLGPAPRAVSAPPKGPPSASGRQAAVRRLLLRPRRKLGSPLMGMLFGDPRGARNQAASSPARGRAPG